MLRVNLPELFAYEVIFDRVSVRTGLRSDHINCIAQSADGYMWIGTKGGLQRYDGYRMVGFFNNDGKGQLPPRPVDQLLQAANADEMWIRMGDIVGLFNIKSFFFKKVLINYPDTNRTNLTLYKGASGITYLLLQGKKVLVYNSNQKRFIADPKFAAIPGNFKPNTMQVLPNGDFYLAGENGLGYFDKRASEFYTAAHNPKQIAILNKAKAINNIRLFFSDSKGKCFIETWPPKGVFEVLLIEPDASKPRKIQVQPFEKDSYFEVNNIAEYNGLVWASGNGIFNIYEPEGIFEKFYDQKNAIYGIPSSVIFQLFKDRENNLWIATNNGLYMASVIGNYMRNASANYVFGNHPISSVIRIEKNGFLLGSWGGGVAHFTYNQEHVLTLDKIFNSKFYADNQPVDFDFRLVWSIAADHDQNLWIGCQHGRLIFYDHLRKKSTFSIPAVFAAQTIRSVAVDGRNRKWFGTQGGKLVCFDQGRFSRIISLNATISKLYVDKRSMLWIATGGKGLIMFDPEKSRIIRRYVHAENKNSLSSDLITDVTQVNDTLMAIACDANLDLLSLRTGKIINMNPYNGLQQNVINALIADKKGYLWMSGNGGVARLNPANRHIRYYDQKDGMVNTSMPENQMSIAYKLSEENLFFGSEKNFMIFNPDSLNAVFTPENVSITGFRLFDKYVPITQIAKNGVIRLNHQQNVFTINFSCLSYKQTPQLKYAYKLQGASDQWISVENAQSASFASLSPGHYTFIVYATNQQGIRSPQIARLLIDIVPEFYQTKWFMLLVILVCMVPVFIIYRLRVKRAVEVYRLREKVARDLHDDMGSTLTSINILCEVTQNGLKDDQKNTREYMRMISQNSSQMMESMDDIVWSIKPENDQLGKIIVRLREYAAQILEPQNIRYVFKCDEHIRIVTLPMDSRRNLFMIYKEALNNISKYAFSEKVDIGLVYRQKQIVLSIKDFGRGFDMKILNDGNGLMNMRKRAELMKGKLEITSVPGEGTIIMLHMPVTQNANL